MYRLSRIVWACVLMLGVMLQAGAQGLPPAVEAQIPAWFAEAEGKVGKDAAAVARHMAWRIGWAMSTGTRLDGDGLRLASREVQRRIYERYQQPVDRQRLHSIVVEQAFDAVIKREKALPAHADETPEQQRAWIVRRGIEWLPEALTIGGNTAEAAWEVPQILRTEFGFLGHPKAEVPAILAADTAWLKTKLSPSTYAIVLAAAPNRGESYATLGRTAYTAAREAGASEAEARQIALRAMSQYAKRISEADRTDFFVGLHAGRIVDAARAYTDDEAELLRVAREAVSYGGGGTASYERLRDDIRRRAGTLAYPPVPPDNDDLRRLTDALNRLDSEMAVLEANATARLDPVVAEQILDHLTGLAARFGDASDQQGAPWERASQPQPDSLIGWMKAYRYLYVTAMDQLTKNGILTDTQIQEVKDILVLQQTLMEINQTMMDLATFHELVAGGGVELKDDLMKLWENPDVPGISRALETVSKLDKAWSYGQSPFKMVEKVKSYNWDSPEAATVFDGTGVTGKDLGSIAQKVAKASHEQARDTRKALRLLREDLEKLMAMHQHRQGTHIPSLLKEMRQRNTVGEAMKSSVKSKNLMKVVNSILVPLAKADHAARVQELRELQALSRSDQQHLAQVRMHWAETTVRAEQEVELANRISVSLKHLRALYQEKAFRSYDYPAAPAPTITVNPPSGVMAQDAQHIGTALQVYNAIVGAHTENIRILAPHLILPPDTDPTGVAHQVLIVSDFQRGDDGWYVSGEGLPTRKARWLTDGGDRGNRIIGTHEPQGASGALDVVVVIDVSMSMKDAMNSIKQASAVLVRDLGASIQDLRLGIVAYTDVAVEGNKAIRTSPLMADLGEQMAVFQSLTLGNGGATYAESQYDAIAVALERFAWRSKTAKGLPVGRAILVITDAGSIPGVRTPEQLIASCNATKTRIYSMVQGDSQPAWTVARALTAGTGGATMSLRDPHKAAADLQAAMLAANEAMSPRYVVSPPSYGGDRSSAHHYTLSYRIRQSGTSDQFDAPDIVLVGKTTSLTYTHPVRPSTTWTQVNVPLHVGRGWRSYFTGLPASEYQMKSVLESLVQIKIRAEYQVGDDRTVIDDVRLYGRPQFDLEQFQKNILLKLGRWEADILQRSRSLRPIYGSLDTLRTRLQAEGVRDPALYIQIRDPQDWLTRAYQDADGKRGPHVDLYGDVLVRIDLTRQLLEAAKTSGDQLVWISASIDRAQAQWTKEATAYEAELQRLYGLIIADAKAFDRAPSADYDARFLASMRQLLQQTQAHAHRHRDYMPPRPIPEKAPTE